MAKKKTRPDSRKQARRSHWRGFLTFIVCLIVFCALAFGARFVVFDVVKAGSNSMQADGFNKGDIVYVNKLSAWQSSDYARGDVVYAHFQAADNAGLIRKVVGVPGDYLEERDGEIVLIYGDDSENEMGLGVCTGLVNGTIPEGAYLLLADDSSAADGRQLGLVYKTDITGTACAVIWPYDRAGRR